MDPRTKELVQESWRNVEPVSDAAARLFYARLFSLDPALRSLFHIDDTDAGDPNRELMAALGVAVRGLDWIEQLRPVLVALGRKHGRYGIEDEDYDTVGAALLWTLQQGLGPAFNAEVRAAWIEAYRDVTSVMKASAAKVRPAPQLVVM